jgi:hypothetical protein
MRKRYEEGGEIDAMEEADKAYRANKRPLKEMGDASAAEETGQFGDAGSSRVIKATPKAKPEMSQFGRPKADMSGYKPRRSADMPMPMPSGSPGRGKSAEMPVDVTKLSVAERRKLSRENPSVSGPTDRRSINERIKSAFGMKSGGKVSASSRADGIAQRGKTRGKMC